MDLAELVVVAPVYGMCEGAARFNSNLRGDQMTKTNPGNFLEDFRVGQVIEHATPRTVTEGDRGVACSIT